MTAVFKFTSQKAKEYAILERLKGYYNTINGDYPILNYKLAKADLARIKMRGMVNFSYRIMTKGH